MSHNFKKPAEAAFERTFRGIHSIPWGVDFLDDALLGVCLEDLVVLGAGTGVGKTQIAAHIAMNASQKGKNVLFLALEAEQGEIENRLLYERLSREWWTRNPNGKPGVDIRYIAWRKGLLEEELFEIEKEVWSDLNLKMANLTTVYQSDELGFTVRDFVAYLEKMEDFDMAIVDHLHYFDFEDQDEMRGLKKAVKLIRQTCLKKKKPILLLSHLRKMDRRADSPLPDIDDFHGSSDITKVGVNVVLIARAPGFETAPHKVANWIYLPKGRHAGDAVAYAGLVTYDLRKGNYSPGYVLHRADRYKAPEEIPAEKHPRWAKHAVPSGKLQGPPTGRVF